MGDESLMMGERVHE